MVGLLSGAMMIAAFFIFLKYPLRHSSLAEG
jgi:Na+-translocating ferredoxin:NAD+ oxidoreductase RnfD subunit